MKIAASKSMENRDAPAKECRLRDLNPHVVAYNRF